LDCAFKDNLCFLDADMDYFARWLRLRAREDRRFGRWFLETLTPHLTGAVARRLTREVVAEESWSDAAQYLAVGDIRRARTRVLRGMCQLLRTPTVFAQLSMLSNVLPGHRLRRNLFRVVVPRAEDKVAGQDGRAAR
jgi:hypothetical protein